MKMILYVALMLMFQYTSRAWSIQPKTSSSSWSMNRNGVATTTTTTTPTPTTLSSVSSSSVQANELDQQWDAALYRDQHSFVYEFGTSLIDILNPQPGERILDIGCGTGELTHAIAQRVQPGLALGMDANLDMLEAAQLKFPNVFFFHGNASNFTIPQQQQQQRTVNAIFSNAALHWVPQAESAVQCMAQALCPGGRLVVEFGGQGNVQRLVQAAKQVLERNNRNNKMDSDTCGATTGSHDTIILNRHPWYFPSIGEYTALLEQYGLQVTSAMLFDRPTVLEDGERGIRNWYRMFGRVLFPPPPQQQQQQQQGGGGGGEKNDDNDDDEMLFNVYMEEIENMLRPHLWNGTHWMADYRRLRIVARKAAETTTATTELIE